MNRIKYTFYHAMILSFFFFFLKHLFRFCQNFNEMQNGRFGNQILLLYALSKTMRPIRNMALNYKYIQAPLVFLTVYTFLPLKFVIFKHLFCA